MTESKQVKEWQAQARKEGRDEGTLLGQIQLCQRLLNQPVSPRDELLRKTRDELARLATQLEHQLIPRTNGHS